MDIQQTNVDSILNLIPNSSQNIETNNNRGVKSIIDKFFQNLIFTKVDIKDDFAIYAAKISSQLGDGQKQYVLLFVRLHNAIGEKTTINNLLYLNLQVRVLKTNYRIPEQRWRYDRQLKNIMFVVERREQLHTVYRPEDKSLDFEMLLKHNPKKSTVFQYQNKMLLSEAFDTFNCILQIPY